MEDNHSSTCQLTEPFSFYRLILNTDQLHFGFWPEESPDLTLQQAQGEMLKKLLAHFPKAPATVLDAGCGLGKFAHSFSQMGYHITAISPSKELIDYASKYHNADNIEFLMAEFLETNDSILQEQKFDAVFFQKSLQYFKSLDRVFKKTSSLLKPEGVIIIAEEICYDALVQKETTLHLYKNVITTLLEHGFCIIENKEIGGSVVRTYDKVIGLLTKNFERIASVINNTNRLEFFLENWKSKRSWYINNSIGYAIIVAKKDEIFVREYHENDERNILSMFNKIFVANRTTEDWYWKFRDNPFGTYKIAEAISENGDLAAHYCGYPVPFFSSTGVLREFTSFQAGDIMTNPSARHLGLGKTSVLARVTTYFYHKFCIGNIPFIYGYTTGTHRKFGKIFLQYEYLSHIPYHFINIENGFRYKSDKIKRFALGLSIKEVSSLSREYDLFFDRVCVDYGTMVARKSKYLKWRYLDCPKKNYNLFLVKRFGRIIGWSVFSIKGSTLIWGDALFEKRHANLVGLMLDFLLKYHYPSIIRIEGWFSPVPTWWTQALIKIGFKVEEEPNKLAPTFKIFDNRFSTDFFESNFYYTMGDSDLF